MHKYLLIRVTVIWIIGVLIWSNKRNRSRFEIDYENNVFLKDGQPFTYASGEMHYFRIPKASWEDRLMKARAAGLNAISTYIEWSLHEPSPGVYNFTGEADIALFIRLAKLQGLLVIIRPGPYICAERDLGGYPSWLLTVNPKMHFRTSDQSHTFFIARWFKVLMGHIQPLLYGNGGPIIMVQVENEYGSYPVNDLNYVMWLRDLYRSYVGDDAVLFTTDGPGKEFVRRGKIPGVFSTIDFGPTSTDPVKLFGPLQKIQPNGPLVNSEYYVGWLTYWGEKFSTASTASVVKTLKDMIAQNISFNMYMFHGGTNFGFTSGSGTVDYFEQHPFLKFMYYLYAGSGSSDNFQADITSYDYDAPITEAGDLTEKYFAIKEALSEKYPGFDVTPEMEAAPKGDYGTITMKPLVSLVNSPIGKEPFKSQFPVTMEDMAQRYGFISYTTKIPETTQDPSVLQVNVRDRALVLVDNILVSVLQYTVINETPLPSNIRPGKNLTLIVENMGRRNYKLMSDCTKGIISNATLDGQLLQDWTIVNYPLTYDNISKLEKYSRGSLVSANIKIPEPNMTMPAFYAGVFYIPEGEHALDTFLDMAKWGKGVVFINNHNIGRYWHIGPQKTLYIPASFLFEHPYKNTITILELHYTSPNMTVRFRKEPDFGLVPREESAVGVEPSTEQTTSKAPSTTEQNTSKAPSERTTSKASSREESGTTIQLSKKTSSKEPKSQEGSNKSSLKAASSTEQS